MKPAEVLGQFATSGHGIQIKSGDYKGRLVQQFSGRFTDGGFKAYSVYSDDHGESWHMGNPVGWIMDENKVVELSDGRLMMNSRANNTHTARWVSYSSDGGVNWSEPKLDYTLTDPRNNASIIRKNPNTFDGSRASKELLFSNANNAAGRSNGSVRYSCDDGVTWPVVKVFQTGATSYSDMVALDNGKFGLVYEGYGSEIRYGTFDDAWLKPFCAAFPDDTAVTIEAGTSKDVTITMTNNDDRALPAGTATVELGQNITAEPVEVPALQPGESTDITLAINVLATAMANTVRGDVVVNAGDFRVRADLAVTVESTQEARLNFNVTPSARVDRDVETNPYQAGEEIPFSFKVESLAPVTSTVVPTEGVGFNPFLPPGQGNCRYRNLGAGQSYNCETAKYTVTAEDVDNGFIAPVTKWEMTATGYDAVTKTVNTDVVSIKKREPALSVDAVYEIVDESGEPLGAAPADTPRKLKMPSRSRTRATSL